MPSNPRVVVSIRLTVTPEHDTILPPLSSKVLKYVAEEAEGLLAQLSRSRASYKPLFVSMLYRDGKPLYSRHNKNTRPLHARKGEELTARISFVADRLESLDAAASIEGRWETPYGTFHVEVAEVAVEALEKLSISTSPGAPTGVLGIRARTPVLITSKILVVDPEYSKKIPQAYRTMPTPGLIAAYSLKLWNRIAGGDNMIYFRDGWNRDASMVARAAEVYMAELDYKVTPETIVIGRDGNGKLRLARGWTGWIVYRVYGKRLAKLLDKTLALATRLGLGKSRGIGLGDIQAQWKTDKH